MATCLINSMATETKDIAFMEEWKNIPKEEKVFVRATILKEAADFIEDKAYKDFGINNKAMGMEISKLILSIKNSEKQNSE